MQITWLKKEPIVVCLTKELVEEGTNDMLNKQLVEKVPISPISTQIHDVSVNLEL